MITILWRTCPLTTGSDSKYTHTLHTHCTHTQYTHILIHCTHTHIHTHTHTYTHIHTHTHTYTHIHTHTHTHCTHCTHIHAHIHAHTRSHTHIHCTHTHGITVAKFTNISLSDQFLRVKTVRSLSNNTPFLTIIDQPLTPLPSVSPQ